MSVHPFPSMPPSTVERVRRHRIRCDHWKQKQAVILDLTLEAALNEMAKELAAIVEMEFYVDLGKALWR